MALEFSEELRALGGPEVDPKELSEAVLSKLDGAVQGKYNKSAAAYTEELLDKLVADFYAAE